MIKVVLLFDSRNRLSVQCVINNNNKEQTAIVAYFIDSLIVQHEVNVLSLPKKPTKQ